MVVNGSTSPLSAANAYRAAVASPGAGTASPDGGLGFGDALRGALEAAADTGRRADVASAQGVLGNGNATDVVLAISKAEMALQTTVAVRDRVIAAYQDIMRMPI